MKRGRGRWERARRRWGRGLRWLLALYAGFLLLLWLTRGTRLEHSWPVTLLLLAPPFWTLILPGAVLLLSGLLRQGRAALAAAAVSLAAIGFWWQPVWHAQAGGTLKVLTHNLYGGRTQNPQTGNLLAATGADALLIQEAPASMEAVEEAFGNWNWVRGSRQKELVIGSRFPLDEAREFSLDALRSGLCARAHTPQGPVWLYTVHFSTSWKGTLTGSGWNFPDYLRKTGEIRRRQNAALLRELQAQPEPAIVGGDFNTTPLCSGPRQLARLLHDAFAEAGQGCGWTYPVSNPVWRIDYLYSSPALQPCASRLVNLERVSDHAGLWAEYHS